MQNQLTKLIQKEHTTLGSGKIIVAKYSELEMKQTITFIKYMNQPVMNAAQKMMLKITKKEVLLGKQT